MSSELGLNTNNQISPFGKIRLKSISNWSRATAIIGICILSVVFILYLFGMFEYYK